MGLVVRSVAVSAAIAASCAQPTKNCFEKYQCVFHHDVAGQEYSWDLHQMCHEDSDYKYYDDSGHFTSFKICGNASQTCAPGYPTYNTHGVAVTLFTESAQTCNSSSPKQCTDYDYNVPTCCTGQGYILGTEYFQFYLIDASNPGKGVKLVHAGMPGLPADPFKCPPNLVTMLDTERSMTITILCDPNVPATDFAIDGIFENRSCVYDIIGRSAAACATKNDPFDCPSLSQSPTASISASPSALPSGTATATQTASASHPLPPPAQSSVPRGYTSAGATFGIVFATAVLTAGLTVVIYVVGESRAWWGSIKKSLPASWLGTGSSIAAGSGAKMSYAPVGSSSSPYGSR